MKTNLDRFSWMVLVALLSCVSPSLVVAQQRSMPPAYGYYTPSAPQPGTRAVTVPQRTVDHVPGQPYAYPSMPSGQSRKKAASVSEIEALRRENESLRRQLTGANPPPISTPTISNPPVAMAVPTQRYTVRRGDSLWGLAIRYGTQVSILRELNGLGSDRLISGQTILLPLREGSAVAPNPPAAAKPAPEKYLPAAPSATHVVKRGETLGTLANRFRVSQQSLQAANRLSSPDHIRVGQRLVIPGRTHEQLAAAAEVTPKSPAPLAVEPRFVSTKIAQPEPGVVYYQPPVVDEVTSYRVRAGDTLDSIAAQRGLTRESIVRLNGLQNRREPAVGEELILPVSRTISG
jgi:LysM repeat protein